MAEEFYTIGVDISDDKVLSFLAVGHFDGTKMTTVNVFTGVEAKQIYEKLIGKKR